jgi:hypothetical protein
MIVTFGDEQKLLSKGFYDASSFCHFSGDCVFGAFCFVIHAVEECRQTTKREAKIEKHALRISPQSLSVRL